MFEIVDSKPDATDSLFHYLVIDLKATDTPINIVSNMEHMLTNGADVDHVDSVKRKALLQYAIERGCHAAASMLLDHNANPNVMVNGGQSHLLILAARMLPSIIPSLLKHGSNVMMPIMENDMSQSVGERAIAELEKNRGSHGDALVAETTGMIWKQMEESASQKPLNFTSTGDDPLYTIIGDWAKLREEIEKERNETRQHYLKVLHSSGPSRRHASSPDLDALRSLQARFPNFSEVIQELENHIVLFNISKRKSLTMPPILMVGEAGIGKTRFVAEAAKVLSLEFRKISCGTLTAGWVIGGSSTSWNEGKPGQVHLALRDGKTVNPLIMLDEIDKISGDSRFDPYGPLYPLLERHTAKEFVDEAIGLPMDCSFINWIATANDLKNIPQPILTRFTVCNVDAPTHAQMLTICQSIYQDLIMENSETWGSRFTPTLDQEVVKMLAAETPRKIREILFRAFGQAARTASAQVIDPDAVFRLCPDDIYSMSAAPKRGIGFLA